MAEEKKKAGETKEEPILNPRPFPTTPRSKDGVQPRIFALLVGINDYQGTVTKLGGCINDVNLTANYLRKKFGKGKTEEPIKVKESIDKTYGPHGRLHLRILTNADATYKNIIKAFDEHLVNGGGTAEGSTKVVWSSHDLTSVSARLHWPDPLQAPAYAIKDYPRFFVPPWGPTPIPQSHTSNVDPALVATNGYDFRQNVDGDVYVFLGLETMEGWAAGRADFIALGGGRCVAPEFGRVDNLMIGIERHEAVLLAGNADPADLGFSRPEIGEDLGYSLAERVPPDGGILLGVTCWQAPDEFVGLAGGGQDVSRVAVERHGFQALRAAVDAECDHWSSLTMFSRYS